MSRFPIVKWVCKAGDIKGIASALRNVPDRGKAHTMLFEDMPDISQSLRSTEGIQTIESTLLSHFGRI